MFCQNCGNEIKQGERFCSKCGAPIEQEPVVNSRPNMQSMSANRVSPPSKTKIRAPKKPGSGNLLTVAVIGGICVAIIVAFILVRLFVISPMLDDGANQLVYLNKGDIYYLEDMAKPDKAILVDDTDYSFLNAWFSEDGKYLYYYSKEKNSTVCRILVSKIKANSKNRGKYVEKVGSDMYSLTIIDDKRFLYRDDKDRLILNNNGKEETVDKDVSEFSVAENKNIIYYKMDDEKDDEALCYIDISTMKGDILDKNILNFYVDGDYVFFTKRMSDDYSDYKVQLYSAKGTEAPQKIDEDIYTFYYGVSSIPGKVYYLKAREEVKKCMEYVEDDSAQADATLTEPQVKDFLVETNESTVMNDCLNAEDVEYYSDGKNKADFYKYWLNYDADSDLYYIYGVDDVTYYCDYNASKAKGYKKAKWYKYDYEAADIKWEEYYAAETREEYRSELNEQEYTYTLYDLYCATSNEDIKRISESVSSSDIYFVKESDAVIYGKLNSETNKVKLSEIVNGSDIYEYLDEHLGIADGTYCYVSGQESKLELNGQIINLDVGENGWIAISASDSVTTLYAAQFSNGALGGLEKVADLNDGNAFVMAGSDLYYYSECNGQKSVLSVYRNGSSKEAAKSISTDVIVTIDGTVINNVDGDLELITNGEKLEVSRNVDSYSYINEKAVLYVKEDDLYLYNGSKKDIRIARNVGFNYISFAESLDKEAESFYVSYYDEETYENPEDEESTEADE